MNTGMKIKELRQDAKLKSKEFASMLDISPVYLSYIEKGTRKPSLDLIKKICEVLNLDLSTFFEDETLNEEKDITIGESVDMYLRKNGIDTSNLSKEEIENIAEQFVNLFITLHKEK